MFTHSLILAIRNLFRHRSTSIINVIGLSIGIMSALVIGIYITYELDFDRYHEKAGLTYKVVQETKSPDATRYWSTTAYPLAEALRDDFGQQLAYVTQASGPVNRIFQILDDQGNISRYDEPYVLFVDAFYPKVFDFNWIQGNPQTALAETNSIVLTESVAAKYFGEDYKQTSILGREVLLNNKDALTVTGLIEDAPAQSSLKYTVLVPYEFFRINNPYPSSNWSGNYQGTTFVVLKPGDSPQPLENQLTAWKKKYLKPEDDSRIFYHLLALTEGHTNTQYSHAPQSYTMPPKILYAAAGVGLFMLLIACVNFVNLMTAQSATRAREIGVRKVLGSSRFGLIAQFISENILIVLLALVISLALTQLATTSMNEMLSIVGLQLKLDWRGFAFAGLVGLVIVLLACFYPAVVMASYKPVESLKNKIFNQGGSGLSLRRALIVLQFSIVQLFIIGTLVVASQMNYLTNKDLGFSREDPILVTNTFGVNKAEILRQKLLRNPLISEVTLASGAPLSEYNHHFGTTFRRVGERVEDGQGAEEKGVDTSYLKFYDLELLAGRNFTKMQPVFDQFIINEKLVKAMGWTPEHAVGQRMVISEGEATIVGVIKDFHNNSLQEELTPCVLFNSTQWLEMANIKISPNANLSTAMDFIEKSWKETYPDGVMNATFLDDAYNQHYAIEQVILKGFTVFAILTIFIGCLGLYGLLSFVTIRKTKEVGIRKVLGASVVQIVTLFTSEFLLLIILAFLIAAPLSYYWMTNWLHDFAYHVDFTWWMFAGAAGITLVIIAIVTGRQSLKAARENPVKALRAE